MTHYPQPHTPGQRVGATITRTRSSEVRTPLTASELSHVLNTFDWDVADADSGQFASRWSITDGGYMNDIAGIISGIERVNLDGTIRIEFYLYGNKITVFPGYDISETVEPSEDWDEFGVWLVETYEIHQQTDN